MNATVALVCLYSPKVYIIVFHPDKNVRKLTMNSATYKKYNAQPSTSYATSSIELKGNHSTSEGRFSGQIWPVSADPHVGKIHGPTLNGIYSSAA